MQPSPREFISQALSADFPPSNPLLIEGWAALAFDRNRYESLAPDAVWQAWFDVHNARTTSSQSIGVISANELAANGSGQLLPAALGELRGYWVEEARFLTNHYVFSPHQEWLVRLDQDVTLFAADAHFLREVVAKLGGIDQVIAQMVADFAPGPEDSAGLSRYLTLITQRL